MFRPINQDSAEHIDAFRLSDRRTENAGIIIVVVILVCSALVANYGIIHRQRLRQAISHSYQTLRLLDRIESTINNLESGQHGYIITGRDSYLAHYDTALVTLDGLLHDLQSDDQLAQGTKYQLSEIQTSIQEKKDELNLAIEVRRASGFEEAKKIVDTDQGKIAMDRIRQSFIKAREFEDAQLLRRDMSVEQSYYTGIFTSVVTSIIALMLVAAVLYLLRYNRHRAEQVAQVLHAQRERIQVTLARIGEGVISTDRSGNITFLNQAAEDLIGWKDAEVQDKPIESVLHIVDEETRQPIASPVNRAREEATVVVLTNHNLLLSRNGREFPIDYSAAPIRDRSGNVDGVVLILRDITKHRQESRRLAELDRRKDEFLAILAHELRNPLAPIKNAVQLMAMIELDDETEELRLTMARQIEQLVHLIDGLLDVSRISQGKIALRRSIVSLRSIVDEAVEASAAFISESGQKLMVGFESEGIFINADAARIIQVISNLLNNAAKYSVPGGTIRLIATLEGTHAVVQVRDEGVGIEPSQFQSIFHMFEQGKAASDRGAAGLGIGLTLVKTLIEMHGGTVSVYSPGKGFGSTFTLRLPTSEQLKITTLDPDLTLSSDHSFRVLLVEDMRAIRMTMAKLMERMGHQVVVAESGEQALVEFDRTKPEVVFSDISMPGMSGYELVETLRKRVGQSRVYYVAITGFGQHSDRERALLAGFDDHIVKPVDVSKLKFVFSMLAAREAG